MRGFIAGSILVLAAMPAMANSIQNLTSGTDENHSLVFIKCTTCKEEKVEVKPDYIVPELSPGTEKVNIIDTDAGKEVVRIEAWQGGSPVRRISKTQAPILEREIAYRAEMQKKAQMASLKKSMGEWAKSRQAAIAPQIDLETKTAAVTPDGATVGAGAAADKAESAGFDAGKLELRLD